MSAPGPRAIATRARREAILDAALQCFVEVGLDATTLEHIRKQSGASVGSIYHHFGSMRGVVAALCGRMFSEYFEGFNGALQSKRKPLASLVAAVRFHRGWVLSQPAQARFFLRYRTADGDSALSEEVQQQVGQWLSGFFNWYEGRVQAGELRPLPRALVLAAILGPCHEWSHHLLRRAEGGSKGSKQELDRAARQLAEVIYRGICP